MLTAIKTVVFGTLAVAAVSTADPLVGRQGNPFEGEHTGDGTFFNPGLGDCGVTSIASDFIVNISEDIFNAFPGFTGTNVNPVCGLGITATFQGRSVDVTVVGSCPACGEFDLDFSPAAFLQLAGDLDVGRISGLEWSFD